MQVIKDKAGGISVETMSALCKGLIKILPDFETDRTLPGIAVGLRCAERSEYQS